MKNQSQYKKRFFYTPGLISLIILPILCIWQINKYSQLPKEKVMQIVLWDKDRYNNLPELKKFYKPPPPRKYFTFQLTGNTVVDILKLNLGQFGIRYIINSTDTVNGIDFHFSNTSQYWALVHALDVCRIEKAKTYFLDDDHVSVFVVKPFTQNELNEIDKVYSNLPKPFCGNTALGFYDDIVLMKSKEQIEKERHAHFDFIINILKIFWLPEVLFFVMIILSVIKFRRFFTPTIIVSKN